MFVPIKSRAKEKKKDLNEAILGTMEVIKKAIENDPTKDILALMRDEMKQAREQDLRFPAISRDNITTANIITADFTIMATIWTPYKKFHSNAKSI